MRSEEWQEVLLGDIASIQTGPFGSQLHASDYVNFGIPSIMPQNIGDNRINENGIARIKREDAERLSKYLVREGDIVYSRRGDVEKRALIREHEEGWLCGTGCLRVRVDQEAVYPAFAAYYLGLPQVRAWVVQHAHGATMPNLNTSILSKVPFAYSGYKDQQVIAATLSCLDDKIELNNRMSKMLEEMAQAIFKSWFVDFEPFQDGEFEHSELGPIPKGWAVGTVQDFARDIICGKTPSTKEPGNYGGDVPFITIPDLHGITFITKTSRSLSRKGVESQKSKTLPPSSVVVSCIATPGLVSLTSQASQTNQQINAIICRDWISPFYVFEYMKGCEQLIKDLGSGGSATLNLNKSQFSKIRTLLPGERELTYYHKHISPLYEKILASQLESETLGNVRDTLLPKLMSGEIRVPEAEKLLEEVL